MDRAQLRQLADRQLGGLLEDADFALLEQALTSDPALRREYLRYVFLHGELASNDEILRSLGEREWPTHVTIAAPGTTTSRAQWWTLSITAALLVALVIPPFVWRPSTTSERQAMASVAPARVLTSPFGRPELQQIGAQPATFVSSDGEARLRFRSGAEVFLIGTTAFGVAGQDQGVLFAGKIATRLPSASLPFMVETSSLRILDLGSDLATEFGARIGDSGEMELHCFGGQIEVHARTRMPRHYWSFDGQQPHSSTKSALPSQYVGSARRTSGLIGSGAADFDNVNGAAVECRDHDPRTFVVTTGVTVEALIAPRWSGDGWTTRQAYDYDEIFRKEDGLNRVLLSFQNDHQVVPTVPSVTAGPCLSFGLNLAGHSYSELDMPLDGQAGRPTLAQLKDGRAHHVVATYDSSSGRKAIYIDGQLAFSTQFPAGTLIISGGSAPACIGNLPSGIEPFSGTIDEVAYYDFALTPDEVAQHFAHVQAGRNYFGERPEEATAIAGVWRRATRLSAGDAVRLDSTTGKSLATLPCDREAFFTRGRVD